MLTSANNIFSMSVCFLAKSSVAWMKKLNDGFAIEGNCAFPTRKVAYKNDHLFYKFCYIYTTTAIPNIYIVKRSKTCKFAKINCLAMGCWWRWSGWMDYGLYIYIDYRFVSIWIDLQTCSLSLSFTPFHSF